VAREDGPGGGWVTVARGGEDAGGMGEDAGDVDAGGAGWGAAGGVAVAWRLCNTNR
jgi:hypothetical protein